MKGRLQFARWRLPQGRLIVLLLILPCAANADPPTAKGPLPWETIRNPPQLRNAKEFLELLGVDASQWKNLFQDQPLSPADDEWVNRILYFLPRVGGENTHRWRKTDWEFDDIAEEPARFQGEILLLRGRATQCERVALLPELVDRYDFKHYFRVRIKLEGDREAIVCTRAVPEAWEQKAQLNERVETHGVFLKTSPVEGGPPQLVCASMRVAWLPVEVDAGSGVTPDAIILADHGFDFGLWDSLKGRQKRGLDDADREPFYQLLATVPQIEPSTLALREAPDVNISLAVKSPEEQTGHFVTVDGTVLRIDRVEVKAGDVQARYGLDHYYTLYVFVPLKYERIGLQRNKKDKNPRIFENRFPVTLCVTELPPGLKPGANIHEHVRTHGVYFKVWTYRPQGGGKAGDADSSDLPQPSPLVIASNVTIVEDEITAHPTSNWLLGAVFLGLLAVLAIIVWRISRSDNRFKRDVLVKKVFKEDQVDLTRLEE
jgi:hypothetical protein